MSKTSLVVAAGCTAAVAAALYCLRRDTTLKRRSFTESLKKQCREALTDWLAEEKDEVITTNKRARPDPYPVNESKPVAGVFSWLGLSPPEASPTFQKMHALFPGALPSRAVLHRSAELLHAKLGATPSNTIYADSVCPDEINHEESALPFVMAHFWGRRAFPMGGLAGVPFVGKTGFFAFSHHVPEDGNVLILFGPHVGISESGELGKHHRLGQSCESSACGAVLAAYNKCKNAPCKPCDEESGTHHQQQYRQHTATISPHPPPLTNS